MFEHFGGAHGDFFGHACAAVLAGAADTAGNGLPGSGLPGGGLPTGSTTQRQETCA